MTCVVCRLSQTQTGKATVTLARDRLTLVVKGVPARIGPNCGEEYVDQSVAADLMKTAEEAARCGIRVDVREYAPA